MQYRRRDSLTRLYDISPRTVDRMVKEMAQSGRYPEDFCLADVGYTLVEEEAFRDYLKNRKTLRNAPGAVPRYRRAENPEEVYLIGVEKR